MALAVQEKTGVLKRFSEQADIVQGLKDQVNGTLFITVNRARGFVEDQRSQWKGNQAIYEAKKNGQKFVLNVEYAEPDFGTNVHVHWPALNTLKVIKKRVVEGVEVFEGETSFYFDPGLPTELNEQEKLKGQPATRTFKNHIALIVHSSKKGKRIVTKDYDRVGYYDVQTGARAMDDPKLINERAEKEEGEPQEDPLMVGEGILNLLSSGELVKN